MKRNSAFNSRRDRSREPIFLVGPSGSGKSVIADLVGQETGWRVLDTDEFIVSGSEYESVSEIFSTRGEEYFRELERRCVQHIADLDENLVVATGGGLPAIPLMGDRLREIGTTVYLKAGVDELWERLSKNEGELERRPLLRSGGRAALVQMLEAREVIYSSSAIVFDTDDLFIEEVCGLIVRLIEERSSS